MTRDKLEDLAEYVLRYWPKDSQARERDGTKILIVHGMEAVLDRAQMDVADLYTDGGYLDRDDVLSILRTKVSST